MRENQHPRLFEEVADWADAIIALGVTSAGSAHRRRGALFVDELDRAGFSQLAASLHQAIHADENTTIESWMNFLVTLELTREALDIARLQQPTESLHAQKS